MSESTIHTLISEDRIRQRVTELATEIGRDYPNGVHVVAVLKGAFIFIADLVRQLPGPVSLDFMVLSSYTDGTTTSGEVCVLKDLESSLDGKDVLIVEDILDTGVTLNYLHHILRARNPRVLKTACLLNKPSRRNIDVTVEYIGFEVEDRFVVGYGLDYEEHYRNLPYIGVLTTVPP
ncbi:MAG: hypoxanthine phosphoribosyltransferase, partial [Acidobacteriaceae bacterium]|nr:hypoxanthine phosphoribosyltransferase [Acidobacteriaceae bacterium]